MSDKLNVKILIKRIFYTYTQQGIIEITVVSVYTLKVYIFYRLHDHFCPHAFNARRIAVLVCTHVFENSCLLGYSLFRKRKTQFNMSSSMIKMRSKNA